MTPMVCSSLHAPAGFMFSTNMIRRFLLARKRTGWGHVSAELDTLRWLHHPDALYPDVAYDLDGCYSGGAVVDGEQVYLFYTGNLKEPTADGGFARRATQNRVNAVDLMT